MSTDSPDPQFSGPVDFDLPCLQCGYDLRGLFGDPVRCPECGTDNPVVGGFVPPELLRRQLRSLETRLAVCALLTLLGAPVALICAFVIVVAAVLGAGEGLLCAFTILAIVMGAWAVSYTDFRAACGFDPNWRRVFWRYQLRALGWCLIVASPSLAMFIILGTHSYVTAYPEWHTRYILAASFVGVGTVVIVFWPLRQWRMRQREHLEPLLREAAIRRARERIRRERAIRDGTALPKHQSDT